jgi:multimeric flavodoxin WrbA
VSRLLIVHHTVSPGTRAMYEAAIDGTRADGLAGVEVQSRPALAASVAETLATDGILLGATANIGYMAGALKHYFDTIYYPLLDARPGLPYGLWLHGNEDATGALRAITAITGALGWRPVAAPVVVMGTPTAADREACWNLGATLAATIAEA